MKNVMKKRLSRLLIISVLVIIDIVIKIIIDSFFMDNKMVLCNWIGFKPYLNTTQLSVFNNELSLGVSVEVLIILNIVLIPIVPLTFYWLKKENELGKFINISEDLLMAGVICSLLDKIFWGGSLDYIYLLKRWIIDLKDIYLFGAICVMIWCFFCAVKNEMCKQNKENIEWLFFDVGSTIVDEHIAYEHRMREIAELANTSYSNVYETAMEFYKQNKKGDLETAKRLGVDLTKWHTEDEILYDDASKCLERLSSRYKIGIIANQSLGTKERLEQHGVLQYIDLVIASAEEGVAKPDKRIFEIALERSKCKPNNAIMIGDRIDNDIIPAKLLGMHTIWMKQGFGQYWNITQEDEKADYVVHSLMDICNILL